MKASTMVATLERLGVLPSINRPRVSNDNPFSKALFRTLKYCPAYPSRHFTDLPAAADWVEGSSSGTTTRISTARFGSSRRRTGTRAAKPRSLRNARRCLHARDNSIRNAGAAPHAIGPR